MGKSIRIYLADGNAIGIRHAEIVNWTGQALACPRSRFADLREWPEVKRPGVYFLFGTDEQSQEPMAYIGEAEVVLDRVATHLSQKAFWSELVAFTNKDENLTKSHVRYLEARLISQALSARRYTLENTTSPQVPLLPRPDRDAMEEYLDSVRTLLGALGHRILEPLLDQPGEVPPRSDGAPPQNTLPVEAGPGERAAIVVWPPRRDMYQLKVSGILATALGLLTLFLGATAVVGELRDALNTIWEVPIRERSWHRSLFRLVKERVLSFVMVLGVGFLLLVSLIMNAGLSAAGAFFKGTLPLPEPVLQILTFGVSFVVTTGLFALIYKVMPDVDLHWRNVMAGAVLTSLLFSLGKLLIGLYLGRTSLGSSYGAAGSLAVLLVWIYFSAQIFLFGAEFTHVLTVRYGLRHERDESDSD